MNDRGYSQPCRQSALPESGPPTRPGVQATGRTGRAPALRRPSASRPCINPPPLGTSWKYRSCGTASVEFEKTSQSLSAVLSSMTFFVLPGGFQLQNVLCHAPESRRLLLGEDEPLLPHRQKVLQGHTTSHRSLQRSLSTRFPLSATVSCTSLRRRKNQGRTWTLDSAAGSCRWTAAYSCFSAGMEERSRHSSISSAADWMLLTATCRDRTISPRPLRPPSRSPCTPPPPLSLFSTRLSAPLRRPPRVRHWDLRQLCALQRQGSTTLKPLTLSSGAPQNDASQEGQVGCERAVPAL